MAMRQVRGGIERKFITAIIWVGVLPMALALLLGFIFALQGQQRAIEESLVTTVETISGGFRNAMGARLYMAEYLARDPVLRDTLANALAGRPVDAETFLARLPKSAMTEGDAPTAYFMFSVTGELLFKSDPESRAPPESREWIQHCSRTEVAGFGYSGEKSRYLSYLISPITDRDNGEKRGYLLQAQGVAELVEYVLGRNQLGGGINSDDSVYELVYLGVSGEAYVVYLDGEPRYHAVDETLRGVLHKNPASIADSMFLWDYVARGKKIPVLLAYHRLEPHSGLYLIAYRSMTQAVGGIAVVALTVFLVSVMVIGVFCIAAYRFVNNNIIRPVSLLNEGAQIIRQGDLDLKLKINTGDEIEELAVSFNKMALSLRQYINRLEDSEEKYRHLINAMRDGIYQTDNDGVITLANPAAVELLGYESPEDLLGTSMKQLFLEEMDQARVSAELERHRYIERTRVWFKKKDGKSICVELAASRVFDELGLPMGMEGTLRDVTHNVRLEQEARERNERLAAINQIANVINSSLEAGRVYESIVGEVRKLFSFDYAAVALLNQEGDTFMTRQLWPDPPAGQPQPHPEGEGSCAAWVAREKRCLIVERMDVDGKEFAAQFPREIHSCLCLPLYATGRIIGTFNLGSRYRGAFTKHEVDVLEQMAPHLAVAIRNAELLENLQHSLEEVTLAREKLHEVNEELKTLDEMKTNLLSNVSHELRTPLVSVMGYTDMILNGKAGPTTETQQEYLGISLRNIEKLVTLIENLLDFSRLHRGDEDIVFDTFDLLDCARASMQIVKPVADSREIALILNCPEATVLVEGDKSKVGQVFNNLLSNAVKFNDKGGSVTIDVQSGDEMADVTVTDTGIGMPESELDQIFSRFYQVDSSSTRKYGGTGIGLAIAQDIMRLHGSRITVSSVVGQGSTFRFSMPLSMPRRAAAAQGDGERMLPLPTETHLLVELVTQDRALSAQVRQLLLSEGMDVIHAAYPAVAVSLANKYSPDCILLDTEAGPLGSVVLEEIISDPSAGVIPIVLLTNDDQLYERHRHEVAGRVRRGFRKSSLLGGIHAALSRSSESGEQLGNKVLCVDDDPEILRFITRCLEAEGFETECCGTGEEAIERAKSSEFWLVLLDIAMPGMDGWETCQRIRTLPNLGGVRVYMVTAKPMDRSLNKVRESGAAGYLMKPFKAEDLRALVEGYEWRKIEMR